MILIIISILTFLFIFLLIFGIMQYLNFVQGKKKLIKKVQDAQYTDTYDRFKGESQGQAGKQLFFHLWAG